MAKKVFYNDDARARILAGAEALYNAVKVTYGPKGGNVVIGHNYYGPSVTHDGVTVAQAVELDDSDPAELGQRVGAELIKQAASNLNKLAGDGTTTVTILTYHILNEANRLITAGHNPQAIRRGIEEAGEVIIKRLEELAEPIDKDSPRVRQIATISAGDAEIGDLLADVISKIGKDSAITVELGQGTRIDSEVVEGFSFDTGWASPLLVTDTTTQEAVYENPAIIITEERVDDILPLVRLIGAIIEKEKRDIVLIADEVDKDVLATLVMNKMQEKINTVVVKAPGFGDTRRELLCDIATFTGATVLTKADLANPTPSRDLFGSCRKIVVGQDKTTIVAGTGDPVRIEARVQELKNRATTSELDRHRLDARTAALAGKVAVIKVGGVSETEIDERKYRVDDAVAAVQAALAEGIVPGGGITSLYLSEYVGAALHDKAHDAGFGIVQRALRQPFTLIMENAGLNAQALLDKAIDENPYNEPRRGVDIMADGKGFIDLKDAGVIDPVRVTKEAIKKSVSIAATAATMGALVVDLPEKTIANNA